jgi:hypothetical protein
MNEKLIDFLILQYSEYRGGVILVVGETPETRWEPAQYIDRRFDREDLACMLHEAGEEAESLLLAGLEESIEHGLARQQPWAEYVDHDEIDDLLQLAWMKDYEL